MNKLQRKAVKRLIKRWGRKPDEGPVKAMMIDCYMVRYGSMWLGIELDGYTHS